MALLTGRQRNLKQPFEDLRDLVNELRTAVVELIADHATMRNAVIGLKAFVKDRLVTGDPGLAIATDTAKVQLVNNVEFTIDGTGYAKTATDDFWTLTGAAIADGDIRGYVLYVNAAGTASVEATADVTSADPTALTWPDLDDDKAVMGCITIAMSGGTFTPDTTALSDGSATTVYNDGLDLAGLLLQRLPDSPATLSASIAESAWTAPSRNTVG